MFRKLASFLICSVLAFGIIVVTDRSEAYALAGFPTFTPAGDVLNPEDLIYNPTGEIIFPSVIKASDHIASPLGTYYLYYAPHDSPGGINLAYSNSLNGPWTEYNANPLISNNWAPHHNVSHVSSPSIIWNTAANKYYMYYHGENNVTRIASSTNGINFTYEKAAVSTNSFAGQNLTETSYSKVFEYTIPSKGNKYIMVLMGNNTSNVRKIYLAWSNDGLNWTPQASPLITANAAEGTNIAAPSFFEWNGGAYVAYHATSGNIHITEVGANFNVENHLGVLFAPDPVRDRGRVASPNFITEGNTLYMFHDSGPRLEGKLAYATANIGPWNLISDQLSSYTVGWTKTGTGDIIQYLNDINIVDNSASQYLYITKNNFTPPSGAFTFEVRARAVTSGTTNEFTVRSGNYLISLYLTYGTAGSVQNKATSPTKTYTLDTTVLHNYRVVVHANYTYDLYVDGVLRWSGAANLGSGTNMFKIGGDTAPTANISLDHVRMGTGEILP
jgi:hypothetical protein